MEANFTIKVDSFEKDIATGKRKRSDGAESTVFGVRFLDNWCLRYRSPWKLSGASLMVYQPLSEDSDRVWECVQYQERVETIPVGKNEEGGSPGFVAPEGDCAIGPSSFFGYFTTEPKDTKITDMSVKHFNREEDDCASMDLCAVVQDEELDCRKYYSIRMELVRIQN